MKCQTMLLAAGILAVPAALPFAAKAQPATGVYVGVGLGYNIMNHRELHGITASGVTVNPGAYDLFHNGFAGDLSLGYGFGNGFRVELEGDYLENQLHKQDQATGRQVTASGKEEKYGAMVNALYDFDLGSPYIFPYIGAGIGYQFANLKDATVPVFDGGPTAQYANDTEGSFAYQGIIGIAFAVPDVPGLSATVQYNYLRLAEKRNYTGTYLGRPATYRFGDEGSNMITVGLRYALFPPAAPEAPAAAPPPVAAPPVPAPARTYLVFFNWDKADLTPRATEIVEEAAQASQSTHVTQLNVNGYTDTSGSAGYNMKLSYRRADNVAAQLVSDGVPKEDIVIKGYGETHLLVPTGPNVREPQNRRVEIILG